MKHKIEKFFKKVKKEIKDFFSLLKAKFQKKGE